MIKQYVSLEEAKKQSNIVFNQTIDIFKQYCNENNCNSFFDEVHTALKHTDIWWDNLGFRFAGKVIKFADNNYVIKMNINYLYSKDAAKFVKLTLIHEMAHIVAYYKCKNFHHNKIFKTFDKILGDIGKSRHNYKDPTNKPKTNRIEVICPICKTKYKLTKYMYEQCKSGTRICRKCKTNMMNFVK